MNKRIKISTLITGTVLLAVFIIVFSVSGHLYMSFKNELHQDTYEKLNILKSAKKQQIEQYFDYSLMHANGLAKSKQIPEIFKLYNQYKDSIIIGQTEKYTTQNSRWLTIYSDVTSELQSYIDIFGYKDILITDQEGIIVFSLSKTKNIGENILSGKFKKTNLPPVWDKIVKTGRTLLTDFRRYQTEKNQLFAYSGAAIKNERKEIIGAAILQYSTDQLDKIVKTDTVVGESGEILIFGEDNLLRSSSKLPGSNSILETVVETEESRQALEGVTGTAAAEDYRGIDAYESFAPLTIQGLKWGLMVKVDIDEINKNIFFIRISIIFLMFFMLVMALIGAKILIRYIAKPIAQIKDTISLLGRGVQPELIIKYNRDNEIGDIIQALDNLIIGLKNTTLFAQEIGAGKLDASFTPLSQEDNLGNSLLDMRNSLILAKNEEIRRHEEDKIQNWKTEGFTKFNDLLRQNSNKIVELCEVVVANLVAYLQANQGGIFIMNDESKDDLHLELNAAYAYDRKKFLKKKIELNEGLVGTCAVEKATIYLSDVPQDYVEITSGLGKSNPNNLLIVPLLHEDNIQGIIELASFNHFKKYEIEFVEKLAETIATTIASVKINATTAKLLDESRKQAEGLASQEEEMRQNLEEMEATREEASRKEFEMSSIIKAVDVNLIRAEFDTKGILIAANSRFLSLFEYSLEDIIGRNIDLFIDETELNDFHHIWQSVIYGNTFDSIVKRTSKFGKEIWLLLSLTPVSDDDGNIFKVLHLASDITAQKLIENEAKSQSEQLLAQEEIMKQTLLQMQEYQEQVKNREASAETFFKIMDNSLIHSELETDGSFIYVNELFLAATEYRKEELKGKSIKRIIPENEIPEFNNIWQSVCAGNSFKGEIKRKAKNGRELSFISAFNPLKNNENEIEKIIIFEVDITTQKLVETNLQHQLQRLKAHEVELNKLAEDLNINHQKEIQKIGSVVEQQSNTVKTYKNEMLFMSETWMHHLKTAEDILTQAEEENKKNTERLIELEITNQELAFYPHQDEHKLETEIDKLYNDWLTNISKNK